MIAAVLLSLGLVGVLGIRHLTATPVSLRLDRRAGLVCARSREIIAAAKPVIAPSAPPSEPSSGANARCPREPLLPVDDAPIPPLDELRRLIREAPRSLGSASIGTPTRGSLWNGIALREGNGILRAGGYPWGTERVIRSIERAVREVRRCHPNTPPLHVGDIARQHGGWLRPHRSHQAGLDADLGYYYRVPAGWYERATAANLDVVRTWALVEALISGGNVETIFMDLSVQALLKAHIATLPEAERPLEDPFQRPTKKDALIRHTWGHATHFHVRFIDTRATELGKRIAREQSTTLLPKPPRSVRTPTKRR